MGGAKHLLPPLNHHSPILSPIHTHPHTSLPVLCAGSFATPPTVSRSTVLFGAGKSKGEQKMISSDDDGYGGARRERGV